jgi:hypothetical protein
MVAIATQRITMSPTRIIMVASACLPRCPAGAARKWRVPAFSVHPLLADEWARVGIHDEELTDRADGVPLRVEPVGQGRASQSEKCSKLNTLLGRPQDALRLGLKSPTGRSGNDHDYQPWGQLEGPGKQVLPGRST